MRMKQIAIWFIVCFLIGFVVSFFIYEGIIAQLGAGFQAVPWFMYLLYAVLMFYVTLSIHELTHLMTFKTMGVGIKALYLTMFVIHHADHKWRLTIKPKLWVLFGGMVVPDLDDITDEDAYQKLLRAFSVSLISAPIATILFAVISMFTGIIMLVLAAAPIWTGTIWVMNLFILFFSVIYIWASRLHTDQFYGDFVAHRKMKEEPLFQLIQINQYAQFSSHFSEQGEHFLFEKAKAMIKHQPISYRLFDLMLLHMYVAYVTDHPDQNDALITKKIELLHASHLARSVHGIEIGYDIATMFYAIKNPAQAYQMYDILSKKRPKGMEEAHQRYLKKKFEHITHIRYNDQFLADKDNIYIGQHWIFDAIMDPYEAHIKGHQPLPFVVYECTVDLHPVETIEASEADKEKSD